MNASLAQFKVNIGRARDLCGIATALGASTTSAIDVTDLLRASLVLAVSALDHYVHEATRMGMLEVSERKRPATDAYLRFQISLRAVHGGSVPVSSWLSDEVVARHGWLSFQDPDKISDALRHVTDKKVWVEAAAIMRVSATDLKSRLRLVVDRRNKIAHEADMDPTVPGMRWPITPTVANDVISFISSVAEAIAAVIA